VGFPLRSILKANDLRGGVPEQWDAPQARALGVAFAEICDAEAAVVGHDMRVSGPSLADAFIDGLTSQGIDAIDLGMCSTDAAYFASGTRELPGAMITASHNPAGDNGMKVMGARARPIGRDTGLAQMVDRAEQLLSDDAAPSPAVPGRPGKRESWAVFPDYAAYLRSLVDLSGIAPVRIAIDAGNGMGGLVAEAVFGDAAGLAPLPIEIIPLYFEPDGTFPNHPPNPLDPANTRDVARAVKETGADLGLAFDGDADRCFVIDEKGQVTSPSAIAAIVASGLIARESEVRTPVIIHNLIVSKIVPEMIKAAGATPIRSQVGHAFIKEIMAQQGAVFGAEHSAHYYFRDFFFADTGILAAMHLLAQRDKAGRTVSELTDFYQPYTASGELNSRVADTAKAIDRIRQTFAEDEAAGIVKLDTLDGLTIDHWDSPPRWWANVRASNTEPLLRLNVEAADADIMVKVRDGIAQVLKSGEQGE
jgi:phosphomannomutase